MQLRVFEGKTLVGDAHVYALDPPMCVAIAKFEPAAGYDLNRHANVIDGDYVGDRSKLLRLEMSDGTEMKSAAISIQDFPTISEREIHIIEIFEPSFDMVFGEHPHFKDYWGKA